MPANSTAENVLGTIGAFFWSIQLAPQIYKSYKRKDTAGLSSYMLGIWLISAIFLGAYVIVKDISIPLIVQPQCFMLLAAISWSQCLHYDQGVSRNKSIAFAVSVSIAAGGTEAGFVFAAQAAERAGHTQVTQALGVLAVIFILGGLIPQYLEIFRFKAVIGISLVFLGVDLLGGFFSMISLFFSADAFDVLAAVSYGAVAVLELGVFCLVPILNPSHKRRIAAQLRLDEEALADGAGVVGPSGSASNSELSSEGERNSVETSKELEIRERDWHMAEVERPAHARGVLGWMDEGVAESEERRSRDLTRVS